MIEWTTSKRKLAVATSAVSMSLTVVAAMSAVKQPAPPKCWVCGGVGFSECVLTGTKLGYDGCTHYWVGGQVVCEATGLSKCNGENPE